MPPPVPLCVVETAVYADNLEQATAFYRDVLLLEPWGSEAGRHVFFRAGQSMLLIFRPAATQTGESLPAHGTRGPGHFALGIAAESYDAWRAHLVAHGVVVEQEIAWPLGGRSIYFRDPAGNSVELITPGVWGLPTGW